jgi:hypothetical protein
VLGAVGYDRLDVAVAVGPRSQWKERITCDGDTGFSALVPDRIDATRVLRDPIGVNWMRVDFDFGRTIPNARNRLAAVAPDFYAPRPTRRAAVGRAPTAVRMTSLSCLHAGRGNK